MKAIESSEAMGHFRRRKPLQTCIHLELIQMEEKAELTSTQAKKILAENKEDTYALDVLAKVNARKKNWTQSRRLFFRIIIC